MKALILLLVVVCVGCGTTPDTAKRTDVVEIADPILERSIRVSLKKSTGELTETDLEKVTYLGLSQNQLTKLPKGLEKLTQLRELNLTANQLTDVKGLEKLTQLRKLYLYGNKLTEAPKELEKLTQLWQLGLDANNLTSVKDLEKLTQLKRLWLDNNPDLTKAQIDELQKALPKCRITSSPTK